MQFSLRAKIIIICVSLLVIFMTLTLFLMVNLSQIAETYKIAIHKSKNIITESHDLAKLIVDMETGQRGFIITGKAATE